MVGAAVGNLRCAQAHRREPETARGQATWVKRTDDVSKEKSSRTIHSPRRRGGDEGDRTLDLTDANRTRSQLRYGPTLIFDRR